MFKFSRYRYGPDHGHHKRARQVCRYGELQKTDRFMVTLFQRLLAVNLGLLLVLLSSVSNPQIVYAQANCLPSGTFAWIHAMDAGANKGIYLWNSNGDGTYATTFSSSSLLNASPLASGSFAGVSNIEQTFLADVTRPGGGAPDGVADWVNAVDLGANQGIYVWAGNGDGTFPVDFTVRTLLPASPAFGGSFTGAVQATFLGATDFPGD